MSTISAHDYLSFRRRQASMPLMLWTSAWILALRLQEGGAHWFVTYWHAEERPHLLEHSIGLRLPMTARHIPKDLVLEIVRSHATEVLATLDQAFEKEFGDDIDRASPEVVARFREVIAEVRSWLPA